MGLSRQAAAAEARSPEIRPERIGPSGQLSWGKTQDGAPRPDEATTAKSGSRAEAESTLIAFELGRDPPRSDAKKTRVLAGVVALVGIACVGMMLILLAILWGHRVRRIIRRQPSKPTATDEFWYLRPKRRGEGPPSASPSNSSSEDAPPCEDAPPK